MDGTYLQILWHSGLLNTVVQAFILSRKFRKKRISYISSLEGWYNQVLKEAGG